MRPEIRFAVEQHHCCAVELRKLSADVSRKANLRFPHAHACARYNSNCGEHSFALIFVLYPQIKKKKKKHRQ